MAPHGTAKKEKLTLKLMVLTSSQAARAVVLRWSGGANKAYIAPQEGIMDISINA